MSDMTMKELMALPRIERARWKRRNRAEYQKLVAEQGKLQERRTEAILERQKAWEVENLEPWDVEELEMFDEDLMDAEEQLQFLSDTYKSQRDERQRQIKDGEPVTVEVTVDPREIPLAALHLRNCERRAAMGDQLASVVQENFPEAGAYVGAKTKGGEVRFRHTKRWVKNRAIWLVEVDGHPTGLLSFVYSDHWSAHFPWEENWPEWGSISEAKSAIRERFQSTQKG